MIARLLLGTSYHRLDPILEKPIPMDDYEQLNEGIVSLSSLSFSFFFSFSLSLSFSLSQGMTLTYFLFKSF